MKSVVLTTVFIILLFVARGHGKVYDRCELARELNEVYKFPQEDIPKWLCLLYWESKYETTSYRTLSDGSANHGLFQINDRYWCQSANRSPSSNVCQLSCDRLRDDDIYDDVNCVLEMFHRHRFHFWPSSFGKCTGNLTDWVTPCHAFHQRSGYAPQQTYHPPKGGHYHHEHRYGERHHGSGIKITPNGIHINLSPPPLSALFSGGGGGLGSLLSSLTGKLRIKPFFKIYKTISLGADH
ncbi:alpha-lactalbumin A-like [Limulus polyphemus]|uniref:lysozyme n=1 Tax=Limulus polyphemus TaxID=6850 RepID=A0ABM1B963_LIMPO|nr:alpha-lactalbumin A-like [Limulus polyphemus]